MTEFLYLYRGYNADTSPTDRQQTMQQWMAWMKDLGEKGYLKTVGTPLEKSGKLVGGKNKIVSDGPFAETKDLISGYTIVQAKDIDDAVTASLGCPIFQAGGSVEVRPILQLNM
jgi:hypothetical protein